MSRFSRLLPAALFFLLAGVLLAGLLLPGERSEVPSPLVGGEVPAFNLAGLQAGNGRAYNGQARKGLSRADLLAEDGVFLVNFWASWCPPCRAEHPLLMRLTCIPGLAIHGIAHKDAPAAAAAFLNELGNPYRRIGMDEDGRAALEWGVYGVPETFIVAGGRILYKRAGPLDMRLLAGDILPLLEARGLSTACFRPA